MIPRWLQKHVLPIVVVTTTLVIIVFAVLQYRWNAAITDATGVRLADTLQMSIVNWQIDLARNVRELEQALRPGPAFDWREARQWQERLEEWRGLTRYPELVTAVYLIEPGPPVARAQRLNPASHRFEAASDAPYVTVPVPAPIPATADQARRQARALPVPGRSSGRPTGAWHFDPGLPALVRALTPESPASPLAVVMLNRAVIHDRIFPDLAHRYFQGTDGLDYEVAVITDGLPAAVLYESDAGFGSSAPDDADGTLEIFGSREHNRRPRPPVRVFHKTPTLVSIDWLPLTGRTGPGEAWRLVVRHRRGGPLGAFLVSTSRRDLSISSAALLLLVASIAMLVVTSNRAQRLAALQMDFVATVSHELRTPLTVIGSAADNITQGVVENADQVKRYGSVIGAQVRQLSALVEQILLFARHGRHPQPFALTALAVDAVVDTALAGTTHLLEAAQFTVERRIPAGLPAVQGDLVAVSQCLQNFIVNALKYGRQGRWIGLTAALDAGGTDVGISVTDRGTGINGQDLPHIFEPFYRGAQAAAAQIHGTGLGLAVARELATAMGGRITVDTAPGQGSTFTLHLPASTMSGFTSSLHERRTDRG